MLDPEVAALLPDAPDERPPLTADLIPAMRAGMASQTRALPAPRLRTSEHRAGTVPLRLYRPEDPGPWPLLVFLHGGGWIFGDLETHDAACRLLADAAGCAVLAVAYRLAPEYPFPAALDDCRAAFDWARAEAAALGCDPARVAIGGESAGGTLAAAVALDLRSAGQPQPLFQLLVHPATDLSWMQASVDAVAMPGLDRSYLDACAAFYVGNHDLGDPRVSPLRAPDLSGLAPAIVVTVEVDPIRDDGEAYALALARADGEVTLRRLGGLPHGFMILPVTLSAVRRGFDLIGTMVRRYLLVR